MNTKAKTNYLMPVIGVCLVLILAMVVYGVFFMKTTPQTTTYTGPGTTTTTGGTTQIVTSGATTAWTGSDKQSKGTTIGKTDTVQSISSAGVAGEFGTAASSYTPGSTVNILSTNGTSYHNAYTVGHVITTGTLDPLTIYFDKNSTVSENIYTTTGLVMANGVGSQNQTALGNGKSYTFKDEMSGTALASTNDMTCIIEITAGNNATTTPPGIALSSNNADIPAKSTATPTWYTPAGTGSRVWLFDIPAINSGATVTYSITATSDTIKAFSPVTYIKKSCYTKENFVDSVTGKHGYDVADSSGTVKSIANYVYTWYFQ